MWKQVGVTASLSSRMEDTRATLWYLEPVGEFSREFLSANLPENLFRGQTACADGKSRDLWVVSYNQVLGFNDVLCFDEMNKTWRHLRFYVWYKEKQNDQVKLLSSDCHKLRKPSQRLVGADEDLPRSLPRTDW